MTLGKPARILIGLLTAWVMLYPLLFFAVWLIMFFGIAVIGESPRSEFPVFMIPFFAIFPVHCLTIFLQLGLSAFYLVHVIKNKMASDTIRIVLGVGAFLLPFVAMPIYYFLYIWPDKPPDWALSGAP